MSDNKNFYRASADDFGKIPGSPIAYWVSDSVASVFDNGKVIGAFAQPKQGTSTGDNNLFLRFWHEMNCSTIKFDCKSIEENLSRIEKWYPVTKGGGFRKWYGNNEYVVDWYKNGEAIRNHPGSAVRNPDISFKESLTWSGIGSDSVGVRFCPPGFVYTVSGKPLIYQVRGNEILSYLCSKLSNYFLRFMSPSVSFEVGYIANLPMLPLQDHFEESISNNSSNLISMTKSDWDSFETSWDFQSLPLITAKESNTTLAQTYTTLRSQWLESTLEMQRLEEENNRIFIDAYGLQDELTPEVPLNEITLTCNPHYRYGGDKTEEQLEGLLLQDTIKEFVSYAVGCMFGRYSLDKPGLILANAGETLEDYLKQVPEPTFEPDDDNVIPLMDVDWFGDDIAERFKTFLKVTFGEANYEENLRFVEDALGYKTTGKGKRQSIRDYFLKDFYTDHWKRYKKRPIYWMFSSPKGTFNALIYMHRYRPDTVSTVLNEYLREFSQKLTAHRDNKKQEVLTAEGKLKIALEKEIATLGKQIEELADYERDLYELASKSREELTIDLDDGVKVNYPKFGGVLKKIAGLS